MTGDKTKILLVDDFEMVRLMLRKSLNRLGYQEIVEAQDGKEAWDLLTRAQMANQPFGMIFCDWSMPEMTGMEVLEKCRSSKEFKNLPFVMVTAEAEQEGVVKALKAGANEYLIKPISAETLQKKIEKILKIKTNRAS